MNARTLLAGLFAAVLSLPAAGQTTVTTTTVDDGVQVIIPQFGRRWHDHPHPRRPALHMPVELTSIDCSIKINDQVSATRLELTLTNRGVQQQEAQILLPVPDGVVVRTLEYDGVGPEPVAEVLPRDEARRIYNEIVSSMRDPALVEFAGYNLIKTSAFPIAPGKSQKLALTYEQVLPLEGERVDYTLPRTEALAGTGTGWTIRADIRSKRRISTVYSPSHDTVVERLGPGHVSVTLSHRSAADVGSVRLSYLLDKTRDKGVTASIFAYPDASVSPDGGFFMILGGLPASIDQDSKKLKREVVLVLDRSGSMRGEKIRQACAAAQQIVDGLDDGESFNIIDYSDSVASFADKPVVKTRETAAEALAYIGKIAPSGGTNIHDALAEALRPTPTAGTLPMVIFLTDGLPTVGERNEVRLREAVKGANVHQRRVFTFGVGLDVNTPLLSTIARTSRAASTFILPEEDVEVKVSEVFRRLTGPVLSSPKLTVLGADGEPDTRSVRELLPRELPDFFEGDQLILLGQYRGGPVRLRLEGDYLGRTRSFDLELDVSNASVRHAHVARMWAGQKIATLVEAIREVAAEGIRSNDPATKELIEEIVALSTRYGILTEYTAFLAREDTSFRPGHAGERLRSTRQVLEGRAPARSGAGSVNQEMNIKSHREMKAAAASPAWKDDQLRDVTVTTVQSVADRTFFQRGKRWVDSRLLAKETEEPDRVVEFGTAEYLRLVETLARENRQSALALDGDVYLEVGKEKVLVKGP
jgi:Ca-activated chloride channel family protein